MAGKWYTYSLTQGSLSSPTWGNADCRPAQADYDGDGKTDFAVFNPDTGEWYVLYSNNSSDSFNWGNLHSLFVAGDMDGDFAHEFIDYDTWTTSSSDDNWYLSHASNAGISYSSTRFGNNSTIPVAGDFDGDTKADYTVFKNGQWYIWKSTTGSMWMPTVGSSWAQPIPQFYR